MHKLVILIHESQEWQQNEERWPEFLRMAEQMPGLRRESTGHVEGNLTGGPAYARMHELFFDTLLEAEQAMASPYGRVAGGVLQQMTGGRLTLFFADHKEDDMVNIRKYQPVDSPGEEQG